MRQRLKVSRSGVELIKSFEGLRQNATLLPDGRWTVGYGHTFSAREGAKTTPEDAESLLRFDLLPVVDAINNLIIVPLNQNQFDALVSFCFNIGVENFAQSTVVKRINEGRFNDAAVAMDSWRSAEYNGQTYVLAPLIRRRAAEKSLFLTPDDVTVSSPSMVVRPIEDDHNLPVIESLHPEALGQAVFEPVPVPVPVPVPAPVVAPVIVPEPIKPVIVRVADVAPSEVQMPPAMAPTMPSDVPSPSYEIESHMSPTVLAALKQAQDEQKQKAEEQARIAQSLSREQMLRAELEKLEQERLAREQADATRLEAVRLERERFEAEQRAAEEARLAAQRAQAEAEAQERRRQEEARLEAERLEAARLEAQRLEAERLEAAKLEAQRLEAERREHQRLEQERLEQERLAQERLAHQALLAKEAEARESAQRQAALAASAPVAAEVLDDAARKAEEQRKAEAAAALMRFYSPYSAASPIGPKPAEAASTPAADVPPQGLKSPFELSAQPKPEVTPQVIHTAEVVRFPTPEPTPAPAQPTAEALAQAGNPYVPEPDYDYTPSMGSPSNLQPPVITALNPYRMSPEVLQKVEEGLHWRDRLNRPVPSNAAAAVAQPVSSLAFERAPTQGSMAPERTVVERPAFEAVRVPTPEPLQPQFPNLRPAGLAAHAYGDEELILDQEHDIIAHDSVIVDDPSWWRMMIDTIRWVVMSGLSIAFIGGAVALSMKSMDASLSSNGTLVGDFRLWSIILAVAGMIFVVISIWAILKRLGGMRNA